MMVGLTLKHFVAFQGIQKQRKAIFLKNAWQITWNFALLLRKFACNFINPSKSIFMKKTLFAMLALASTTMFTACGGKTEATAENTDSAAATAEATEAAAPSNVCENDEFSVTGPEGWEIKKGSFGYIEMEDVNSTETFKPIIKVCVYKDKTLKDQEDYYLNKTKGTVKGADVTIGNYTFTTFRNDQSELYHCFATLEDGRLLEVYTVYMKPENEAVKPVVESIKLK